MIAVSKAADSHRRPLVSHPGPLVRPLGRWHVLLTSLVTTVLLTALLATLTQAVRADDDALVSVSTALEPDRAVVPGERARLLISIATPRWFTAGTRLTLPEVPGLVLLQNQDFASNATERRGSESWSVQRWSIDVFATRAGRFEIPPVAVDVAVSKNAAEEVRSTLFTATQPLTVTLPEALAELDNWIASPKVSLSQQIEGGPSAYLGDAIRQRITIQAEDVMAMFIPELELEDVGSALQRYPEPPTLRNRANRGTLRAERRHVVTWIAAKPGEVTLPAVRIHWWNTNTNTLDVLHSDPITLTVSGELPPRRLTPRDVWPAVLLLCAVLLALWLLNMGRRLGVYSAVSAGAQYALTRSRALWRVLSSAALPDRLNPGGTPGESSAKTPPER